MFTFKKSIGKTLTGEKSTDKKQSPVIYYWIVVLLFPFILMFLLELSLRAFDYGMDLSLFVPLSVDPADRQYLRINRRVAQRYFPLGHFSPRPTSDGFLKEKPANGYRIFALGGSTIAGWPYPNNVMFTRSLQKRLAKTFPEKQIEVINLGIAAINSFSLLDVIDEVLQQHPDAILIYAGHNEFYGALGAASTVSMGDANALIRLYLRLQRFKVFLLMRDAINGARQRIQAWDHAGSQNDASALASGARPPTLMGKMIGENQIALGSETYERGKAQFRENLDTLLSKTNAAGIPVIISELVSNLRDHPPFFSHSKTSPTPAEQAFSTAQRLESEGRIEAARAQYIRAKDLDGLRFRAPEDFNDIIHELAEAHGTAVVPMKSYFEAASPNRLVGSHLMLEHLHPNAEGHQLMSRAFFESLQKHRFVSEVWDVPDNIPENLPEKDQDYSEGEEGFSELDVALGKIRILHITDHWPFKLESESSNRVETYTPQTKAEELAREVFLTNLSYPDAHMKMAEHYASKGFGDLALLQYWALVNSAPLYLENYPRVVQALIEGGSPQQALPFIQAFQQIGVGQSGPIPMPDKLTDAAVFIDGEKNETAKR